jgi:hypothetical protein
MFWRRIVGRKEIHMSVKIREKREKLYLDIYAGGKRTWEALRLTLVNDKNKNESGAVQKERAASHIIPRQDKNYAMPLR